MGIFDTYVNREDNFSVQIKIDQTFVTYRVGQRCPLPDGVYIGNEGAVVVQDGYVLAVMEEIYDKYGDRMRGGDIIHHRNPIVQALGGCCASCGGHSCDTP